MTEDLSDAALAASLPGGFESSLAEVNGTQVHFVQGGDGPPLVLLPGWPLTWWSYHKLMPELAEHHRVIAVDIRGMGGSGRPASGYDKRTMAADVRELVRQLGHRRVDMVGHDIGAMVAQAYAWNHPEVLDRLVLFDLDHPTEAFERLSLLPLSGEQVDPVGQPPTTPFRWWFAFNQLVELPERMLAGRMRLVIDWLADFQAFDPNSIDSRSRRIYARAYDVPGAIRAGNGWYRTFAQDIGHTREYGKIDCPLLVLAGEGSRERLRLDLPRVATDFELVVLGRTGHYVPEESPRLVLDQLRRFLGGPS